MHTINRLVFLFTLVGVSLPALSSDLSLNQPLAADTPATTVAGNPFRSYLTTVYVASLGHREAT